MAALTLARLSLPADAPVPPAAGGVFDVVALIDQQTGRAAPPVAAAGPPPAPVAPLVPRVAPPPVVATIAPAQEEGDDIVVRGRSARGDPLMGINTASFEATQAVDRAVVSPASRTYRKIPTPIRMGLRNFIFNLREPIVFVNYLLQLKPGKAAETAGRFVLNSTVGIGGVLDVAVAKPFRLPRRRNSFANTLGYYGVRPGPFLFLPLLGPTTVRDLLALPFDQFVVPVPIRPFQDPKIAIPAGIASSLDTRTRIDDRLEAAKKSGDFYGAMRTFYLQRRQAEIDHLKGRISEVTLTFDSPPEPAPIRARDLLPVTDAPEPPPAS